MQQVGYTPSRQSPPPTAPINADVPQLEGYTVPGRRLLALAKALEALLDHGEAGADEIAVYVALARHTDPNGSCHPSQTTMGMRLGKSRPWVNARVSRLVDMGFTDRVRRRLPKGGEATCHYYLPHLDIRRQTAVPQVTPSVTGMTPPVPTVTQNLTPHQPCKKPSLSASERFNFDRAGRNGERLDTTPILITATCQMVPPAWAPTLEDIDWANAARPDIDPAGLQAFTAKFIAKINAAGGTHRPPSTKWREWLATEFVTARQAAPQPPSCQPSAGEHAHQPVTPVDHQMTTTNPSAPAACDQPPTPTPSSFGPPGGEAAADRAAGAVLAVRPQPPIPATAPSLPPMIAAAASAARQGLAQPAFTLTDQAAKALATELQPALAALDSLFMPTTPANIGDFLRKFGERHHMPLPRQDLLALDVAAISAAVPGDLFATACRRLWESFAYRRLPAPPDFIKAVEEEIRQRKEAAARIRELDKRLTARADLARKQRLRRPASIVSRAS